VTTHSPCRQAGPSSGRCRARTAEAAQTQQTSSPPGTRKWTRVAGEPRTPRQAGEHRNRKAPTPSKLDITELPPRQSSRKTARETGSQYPRPRNPTTEAVADRGDPAQPRSAEAVRGRTGQESEGLYRVLSTRGCCAHAETACADLSRSWVVLQSMSGAVPARLAFADPPTASPRTRGSCWLLASSRGHLERDHDCEPGATVSHGLALSLRVFRLGAPRHQTSPKTSTLQGFPS
jgi:hypothetical protein